jgi:DNA replication protein DnaC
MGGGTLEKTWEKAGVASAPRYKTTLEERVGERARSRLFEMCKVIRMPNANDYRIRPHATRSNA